MRYQTLKQFFYQYKLSHGKYPTAYFISTCADQILEREQFQITAALARHFGYLLIHRNRLRPSPYRLAPKIQLRSGTYALILSSRSPSAYLLPQFRSPVRD